MTQSTKPLQASTSPDRQPGRHVRVLTPAAIQPVDLLRRRRMVILALNVTTYVAMLAWAGSVLATGGWSTLDVLLILAFAIGLPWTVLGFWNAIIGLVLLLGARRPLEEVGPFAVDVPELADQGEPRTAILMTLRNEDPDRAISRLKIVKRSVDATGHGQQFSYFLLSDTNVDKLAREEERNVELWRAELDAADRARIVYRRREDNVGYKAGNLRDFCEHLSEGHDLMIPLDADSVMTGGAIVRLVAIMRAYTGIAILQSLIVGTPATSPFARIFQFGMRHGMRAYTMGQAWWVGDCGPFWGHNAVVRIAPFRDECDLPVLPGTPPFGGHVLSHDQYEATLMRRAGYEVRVLPEEIGSFEDNPPHVLEFMNRDVRWCQGNMQYIGLLRTPGLHAISRFQLVWAILMFLGIPAWTFIVAMLPLAAWQYSRVEEFPAGSLMALYAVYFVMFLSPKLAGFADILGNRQAHRYGGTLRFVLGAAIEVVFAFLQGAVSTLRTTIFMIGLLFGTSISWSGQARDAQQLSWTDATRVLWPQTLFGIVIFAALALIDWEVLLWSLPLTAGYLLAIPFAVWTSNAALGDWMQRTKLCAIPEEYDAPPELQRLGVVGANQRD